MIQDPANTGSAKRRMLQEAGAHVVQRLSEIAPTLSRLGVRPNPRPELNPMHETRFEPSGPWVDELTELAQRRAQVRQMGGPRRWPNTRRAGATRHATDRPVARCG